MSKFLKRNGRTLIEVSMLFILSLTPFLWFGNNWVLLGHDSGFRPDIVHHMQSLWNGWSWGVNAGMDWSIFKGFLMIQAPEYIAQSLFGSLEQAQPFVLSFWFFVMAMGMYLAMKGFFPDKKYWFLRLYTSIFWITNFYIIQGWMIAERAKFSLYAALPLSIYLFFATFQKKYSLLKGTVLFALLYFFMNGGGSPPLFGASIIVWIITILFLFVISLYRKEIPLAKRILVIAGCFFCAFLLINAYWISPQVDLYLNTYSSHVASEGGIEGLLAWERVISEHASISNLLRLQGIPDWYNTADHPFSYQYIHNMVLILISFLPLISILFGICFIRKYSKIYERDLMILLGLLGIIGLFFSAGSHPPTGNIYIQLMKHVPGFAIFRSSFYKFAPVLWLSLIGMSGYYIQRFLFVVSRKYRIVLSVIILCMLLFYHIPIFSTDVFLLANGFSTRLQLPEYIKKAALYLNKEHTHDGNILVLPRLDRTFINEPIDTYDWGFFSFDILPSLISERTFIVNNDLDEGIERLYDSVYAGDTEKIQVLLSRFGITDVLYREDSKFSSNEQKQTYQIPSENLEKLFGDPVFKEGGWKLFHTQQNEIGVNVFADIIPIVARNPHESKLIDGDTPPFVRFDSYKEDNIDQYNYVFEAECLFCSQHEYEAYKDSIVLPPVVYDPGTFQFSLTTGRKLQEVSQDIPVSQQIDQLLSQIMYLLAIVKRTQNSSDSTIYIEKLKETYKRIQMLYGSLEGREKIIYANRLFLYLSKAQEELSVLTTDIQKGIHLETLLQQAQQDSWFSHDGVMRYILEIPEGGDYVFHTPSRQEFIINGTPVTVDKSTLQKGISKIEIMTSDADKNKKAPYVFAQLNLEHINSLPATIQIVNQSRRESTVIVDKSDRPALLVHPTSFDDRWQIEILDGNLNLFEHKIVDGRFNGWLMAGPQGRSTIRIYYKPYEVFLQGLTITIITFAFGIILLIAAFIKKKRI